MIIENLIRYFCLSLLLLSGLFLPVLLAQSGTGGIRGQVADPTGAVVPGATVTVLSSSGKVAAGVKSDATGTYAVRGLAPGTYSITVAAQGFAPFTAPGIVVSAGQTQRQNVALQIEVLQQQVQVNSETTTVDTSPDNNASAIVIKGKDLDALSDDPDELQDELQALAGPSAGPNGGQVYIDGFTGGQIPPKSSIREIRVNQNPFSAEYDRLGYGRIEIFTKPGTDKVHGQIEARGNDSVFNSQDPILNANLKPGEPAIQEPSYYSYSLHGNVGGPITKNSSYFLAIFARNQQNESIVDAIDPATITVSNPAGSYLNEAIANPASRIDVNPRIDIQLGTKNTLTARYEFYRSASTNAGLNPLSLPSQAINTISMENTLQLSDSLVLSKNLVDDIRFQYRRIRDQQGSVSSLPSYGAQGTFTEGGNSSQTVQDHQNDLELQNYFSGALGAHSLNFGTRLRAYPDVNYTNGGSNGSYTFESLSNFVGCLPTPGPTCNPKQYSYTRINHPVAQAIPFDAALFYQDDWKVNQRFTFSYGVRWETQNRIHDKDDWAPRVTIAYALGRNSGKQHPKTVVRAGYGWFYQRFTVANGAGSNTPYVIQAIHNNGINEQQYIQGSNIVFNPNQTTPITSSTPGTKAPTYYSIAPNFHAANDMEAAVGVDRQITKFMTGNVTYVYSQGVHQYFTNNVSAADVFPEADALNNIYPAAPIQEPDTNNLQYQSGGFYREHQIMTSVTARYKTFSLFSNYTFSNANGDTSGVTYVPSVASYPGLDYGRTSFDVRNRFMLFGNFLLPWQVSFSPFMLANSGTPYDITTGADLTANNQFNARPTYASSCSEANVVQTQFGCLNFYPYGTGEKIIPYGLGTGPANVSINMRISKVIGIGPRVEGGQGAGGGGGGQHGGPPGLGGGGFSGSRGGPGRLDQTTSHKYNLTLSAFGTNIFNHENLGTPNGVLAPTPDASGGYVPQQFFGKSQSLAGGFFGQSSAADRTITLQAVFSF